jgi:hypothetical protein
MTSRDFIIRLRGFTEASNDFTATTKQWDRIKEVLEDVELQDYDDNPGIDVEIDDWKDWYYNPDTLSGTISGSAIGATGFGITTGTTTVWNDQMGCWHYTNYPEGFGYYTNSTLEGKKEKQQLND